MTKFLIGVLLAALVAVALWQFGVFGEQTGSDEPVTPGGRSGEAARPGEGTELTGARPAGRDEPKDEPKPEEFPLQSKMRVLFLLERSMQWPQFLGLVLKSDPQIAYTYYSVHPPADETPIVSTDEEPVVERPTGDWFAKENFDVLVVGACDPAEFGEDFWRVVVERVSAGQLGLLVWPDMPPTPRGKPQGPAVHPMLTHAVLRTLLPIEAADPIQGKQDPDGRSSVAGVFRVEAKFQVTDAGTTHPASRIVPFPQWSRTIWNAGAAGANSWGSKFVYPVTKVKDGAVTLLNALPEKGKAIPMYVQGPPEQGRVLWFGAHDFGDATYRAFGPGLEKWNAVIRNSFVWLAGRAPRN